MMLLPSLVLSVAAAAQTGDAPLDHWIGMDSLSALFGVLTSVLFLGATVYGIGYVAREPVTSQLDDEDGSFFKNEPESVFTGGSLLLLATMSLAILSRHLALQWVAIEATTLASAPLIYYHQTRRSLEAAWKYLMLCSVGIALALLGIFFIRMTMPEGPRDLTLASLLEQAGDLNHKWLGTAFIFMLVGYGTKMGLAPLHTWLPDAHSEAPSPVSALLSGALPNCAFPDILRVQQICVAAGMASFGGDLLIVFGLFSMGLAGVFILRQADYKRMLAYSSVEHMGILAFGDRPGRVPAGTARGEVARCGATAGRDGPMMTLPQLHNGQALPLKDVPDLTVPDFCAMLKVLRARQKQGFRTIAFPDKPPVLPEKYRGRPRWDAGKCAADCTACVDACPTGAIAKKGKTLAIDLGRCLFCTDCTNACPTKAIQFTAEYGMATRTRETLIVDDRPFALAQALDEQARRLFGRSLKLRQVSAGGCNACEADTNVLGTVVFDLGRFGIQFVASPRHADGLLRLLGRIAS